MKFAHVRAIVNNDEEANENTKIFSNKILKRKETSTSQSTTSTPDNNSTDVNIETDNSPGEKSFSMLKNIIANLESEFVTYKIDANTKLEELYKTLEKKDNEIAMLKQEITNLKTTNDNQQQTLSDLSLKQLETEESIKHLRSEHKNEREKSKKLAVKKIAAAKSTSLDKETQPSLTHTISNCTIPPANGFEPLSETNTSPTLNTPTKENTSPNRKPHQHPITNRRAHQHTTYQQEIGQRRNYNSV